MAPSYTTAWRARRSSRSPLQAFVDILAQDAPDFRAVRLGNELRAKVGGAHFVRLFKHCDLSRMETVLDDAKGDRKQKGEQPERCSDHRANRRLLLLFIRPPLNVSAAPKADFYRDQ